MQLSAFDLKIDIESTSKTLQIRQKREIFFRKGFR